jgi:predicted dienelactone hydrolase
MGRKRLARGVAVAGLAGFVALLPSLGCGQGLGQWRQTEKARRATLKNSDPRSLQPREHPVGYRVLSFRHEGWDGEPHQVDVAVWYPTDQKMTPHTYVYGTNPVETRLAEGSPVLDGRFPLVVYSHGATGSGLSMAFLTERLASRGYVVAGIDYPDKLYGARISRRVPWKPGQWMRRLNWIEEIATYELNEAGKAYRRSHLAYRPRIASATIDLMLRHNQDPDSPFHDHIDADRIGLVGHSFGAWTSLLVAGADSVFHDRRAKAVVALSGPSNPNVYEPDELGQIEIPVMFMYGSEEPRVGRGDDKTLLYDRANPPRFLLEIQGTDHLAFSGGIREEYDSIEDYVMKDPRRAAMVLYSTAFLDFFLKGDTTAKKQLEAQTDSVSSYWKDWGRPSVRRPAGKESSP